MCGYGVNLFRNMLSLNKNLEGVKTLPRKVIWNRYKMRLNRTNESKVMAFQSFHFGYISFVVLIYFFFFDFVYITPPVLA